MKFDKHIDFQLDVIHQSLTDELNRLQPPSIGQTMSDQLVNADFQKDAIHQTLSDEFEKASIQPEKLLDNLSYSHFSELMTKALVEYAIADSDQQLFVSKYLLELPSKKELIAAIEREKNVLREQGVVYGEED